MVEGFILVGNGWRCPLRSLAEELGEPTGSVTDIFLPRWLADHIFEICTPLFLSGCLALIGRWFSERRLQ